MGPDLRARSVALAGALLVALTACGTGGTPGPDLDGTARAAARDFLDRYVDPDGRVVRRDQGGDTVSEGQAYAMLLAEVAGDDATADRVWGWARDRLQRPDGLLSYLAGPDGGVRDPQAASDADLLAAWALARVDEDDDARRLASAVLDGEVARVGPLPLLAAGPWATAEPAVLNPSYWSPGPYAELSARLGEPRWGELPAAAVQAVRDVSGDGARLPPDWASGAGGTVQPAPAPDGTPARYSLDAQRTLVWLAASCDAQARGLAGRWQPLLQGERASAQVLALDGAVLDADVHPLALVAAAAAAHGADDRDERDRLLDEAADAARDNPTYYGDAWVALGRALLQTDLLDACEESS